MHHNKGVKVLSMTTGCLYWKPALQTFCSTISVSRNTRLQYIPSYAATTAIPIKLIPLDIFCFLIWTAMYLFSSFIHGHCGGVHDFNGEISILSCKGEKFKEYDYVAFKPSKILKRHHRWKRLGNIVITLVQHGCKNKILEINYLHFSVCKNSPGNILHLADLAQASQTSQHL